MYTPLIDQLDSISKTTTIRKRNTKTINKDLNSAVDSLLDNVKEESTAGVPTEKIKDRVDTIPDLSNVKRIKKEVVIDKKPTQNDLPSKNKNKPVVWL